MVIARKYSYVRAGHRTEAFGHLPPNPPLVKKSILIFIDENFLKFVAPFVISISTFLQILMFSQFFFSIIRLKVVVSQTTNLLGGFLFFPSFSHIYFSTTAFWTFHAFTSNERPIKDTSHTENMITNMKLSVLYLLSISFQWRREVLYRKLCITTFRRSAIIWVLFFSEICMTDFIPLQAQERLWIYISSPGLPRL